MVGQANDTPKYCISSSFPFCKPAIDSQSVRRVPLELLSMANDNGYGGGDEAGEEGKK
jgi:hypothetical protein